jgi:hypothetical protein
VFINTLMPFALIPSSFVTRISFLLFSNCLNFYFVCKYNFKKINNA